MSNDDNDKPKKDQGAGKKGRGGQPKKYVAPLLIVLGTLNMTEQAFATSA
jgi:hypothetical protein